MPSRPRGARMTPEIVVGIDPSYRKDMAYAYTSDGETYTIGALVMDSEPEMAYWGVGPLLQTLPAQSILVAIEGGHQGPSPRVTAELWRTRAFIEAACASRILTEAWAHDIGLEGPHKDVYSHVVPVATWRAEMLAVSGCIAPKSGTKAKATAKWVANNIFGQPDISGDQAEALCIARWAWLLRDQLWEAAHNKRLQLAAKVLQDAAKRRKA